MLCVQFVEGAFVTACAASPTLWRMTSLF